MARVIIEAESPAELAATIVEIADAIRDSLSGPGIRKATPSQVVETQGEVVAMADWQARRAG